MFQIRREQVQALDEIVVREFERNVVKHLRENLPELVAAQSDDQLRKRIRRGWQKAKTYGLESQRQAVSYIDSAVMLGENFEENSRHAWAAVLLEDNSRDPSQRAEELLARASTYFEQRSADGGQNRVAQG